MPYSNQDYMIGITVLLILIIMYFLLKQNFTASPLYTSGAQQRFYSEFTSTNQEVPIQHVRLAEASMINDIVNPNTNNVDKFTSHNRFAGAKHKIFHNSPESEKLENELFKNIHMPLNL